MQKQHNIKTILSIIMTALFLSACGSELEMVVASESSFENNTSLKQNQGPKQFKPRKKFRKKGFKKVIASPTRILEERRVSPTKSHFRVKDQDSNIRMVFSTNLIKKSLSEASELLGSYWEGYGSGSHDIHMIHVEMIENHIDGSFYQNIYIPHDFTDMQQDVMSAFFQYERFMAFIMSQILFGSNDPFNMTGTAQAVHDNDGGFLHDMAEFTRLGDTRFTEDTDGDGDPDIIDKDDDGDGVPDKEDKYPKDKDKSITAESEGGVMYFNSIENIYAYYGLDHDFLMDNDTQDLIHRYQQGLMPYSRLLSILAYNYSMFR